MPAKNNAVRVRFAPSPTGYLHIGSFRAALFNYLFARHHKGSFLLRIEDTDRERSDQQYVDSIMASLRWVDLLPDEPVVMQSSRIKEHKKLIQQLLVDGHAYRCYCTQEEIVERYQAHYNTTDTFIKYDGACRDRCEKQDLPFVVRFALPRELDIIVYQDLIRGEVAVSLDQLDDFIIARSDGTPTYNFVVVADDMYMRITHVIRGDDHIANTPKQIVLYQALGYSLPQFAHIPLILGPNGNKLSKRDAATSVVEYKHAGYLPNAFINYLARLGWAHGDEEIFSRDKLISLFTLDAVGKSGAIFDIQKLNWLNGVYMRNMNLNELYEYIVQEVCSDFKEAIPLWQHDTILEALRLYRERCDTVQLLCSAVVSLYHPPREMPVPEITKWLTPEIVAQLNDLIKLLEQMPTFTVETIKAVIKKFCADRSLKLVQIAQPIRLALVGTTASPGIFDLLVIVGKEQAILRLKRLYDHCM